jgi:hypothetical protein
MTDQVVDDAVALVHRDISLIIHEERNPILAAQRTGFVASPAVPYLTRCGSWVVNDIRDTEVGQRLTNRSWTPTPSA